MILLDKNVNYPQLKQGVSTAEIIMKEKCDNPSHIKLRGICTVCGFPAGELTPIDCFFDAPHDIALKVLERATKEDMIKHPERYSKK